MRLILLVLLALTFGVSLAAAQNATRTIPLVGNSAVSASNPMPVTGTVTATSGFTAGTTTQAKATVAATNTFQAALASSGSRKGCTLQYIAVAGTKGYVFFGSSTPSDLTTSFQLVNGQSITCAIAGIGVATDQILVTGTQNDIFIVSSQ